MKFLSEKAVNPGRQQEIDCLKAFCIIPMILLHTFETCAQDEFIFYHAVHILEVFTGAAAFMFCMGLGTRYSRHQSPRDYMLRGFQLLAGAQFLYLLRNGLPNLIAWWIKGEQVYIANALLVLESDIMTFAGFAFLLLALLSRLHAGGGTVFAIGLVMNAAAFALSRVFRSTGNYLLDAVLGFFVVTGAESYFPLCTYFVFVAAGYWIGGLYPRIRDKDSLSTRVLMICAPIAAGWYILRATVSLPVMPAFLTSEQYILNFGPDALANCTAAVSLLALFHKLLARGSGEAPGFVKHLSKHINEYYCISYVMLWPMQTLLLATTGALMPGAWLPLFYGLFTIAVTYGIIEWKNKHMRPGIAAHEGRRRVIAFAAAWILTIAVVVYAYPRILEYANIWNNYLIGR